MPPADVRYAVCGDAAAGALVAAGLCSPDQVLVLHDVLSVGPLARWEDAAQWVDDRERFWSTVTGQSASFTGKPRDLYTAIRGGLGDEPLVLVAACGASDVLFLAGVLAFCRLTGQAGASLQRVRYTRTKAMDVPPQSLPWLSHSDLREGFQSRAFSREETETLVDIWSAVTAPHPDELLALHGAGDRWHTAPALGAMVARFPDAVTGLGHWDRALLEHCDTSPRPLRRILGDTLRAHAGSLDPVGDLYLAWRLERLGNPALAQPLLERQGNDRVLTSAGRAVRAGEASHVHLNAQDDRVLGVVLAGGRMPE